MNPPSHTTRQRTNSMPPDSKPTNSLPSQQPNPNPIQWLTKTPNSNPAIRFHHHHQTKYTSTYAAVITVSITATAESDDADAAELKARSFQFSYYCQTQSPSTYHMPLLPDPLPHFLLNQMLQLPMMPTLMLPNSGPESYSVTNAMTFFVESAAATDGADFKAVKFEAQILFRHYTNAMTFFVGSAAAADGADFDAAKLEDQIVFRH
eukprot:CAMPEP_0201901572 /NCGR_PEP_ID=MMETSP0902-20130614/54503_1 /ASSEMBLY_ACC=CAM_ASM_000551 /TAXON_ID=420261 /ORGANISM="Thalassiosira antarctica, Strain CCMP982" /LENGTH=206 /DNA_ID=CAMNT_0048435537 /DNA_START=529 /DNA_END=1149 /DNA_ORIENTATION=+